MKVKFIKFIAILGIFFLFLCGCINTKDAATSDIGGNNIADKNNSLTKEDKIYQAIQNEPALKLSFYLYNQYLLNCKLQNNLRFFNNCNVANRTWK